MSKYDTDIKKNFFQVQSVSAGQSSDYVTAEPILTTLKISCLPAKVPLPIK